MVNGGRGGVHLVPSVHKKKPISLPSDTSQHSTDWGSTGYLASVFAGEVYLWSSQKNDPKRVTNTGGKVGKCIRWNKNGTALAMAYELKGLAIFNSVKNKIVYEETCNCLSACCITAMEWTTSNMLITGCKLGRVVVWDEQLRYETDRFWSHDGMIIEMRLSCDEKYLVTSGEDNNVRIWFWPQLREHFQVSYTAPVRGIAWHPWNYSLLAIGGGVGQGCVTIWNASSMQQKGRKSPKENNAFAVDSLAWNPLTGELVVSYWHRRTNNDGVPRSSIIVLSNLTTEVDEIEWHVGRVLYLLWGNGGATLATAATDENLCMWNFFGNSPDTLKKLKKKKRDLCSSGNYMFETAKIFGQCIR
ncbi:hypothetical protein PPYR_13364 [Photinus pyralis]|uniref:Uncharacterized protein n=1 Tax=Photinus pyralis TaxID=7054 RepID=A0A5N4A8V3_PHOPY|nr:hypothetical protein PPYR_13364 [Photinus pyralis]